MKKVLIILFVFFQMLAFSQKNDSLKIFNVDSNFIGLNSSITLPSLIIDSTWQQFSSYSNSIYHLYDYSKIIPNCSELYLNKGRFYLKNDSIPYSGGCVVLHNKKINPVSYYFDSFVELLGCMDYNKFILEPEDKIKITSQYSNGKRSGFRNYYDVNGNETKSEWYENGVLKRVTYPKK